MTHRLGADLGLGLNGILYERPIDMRFAWECPWRRDLMRVLLVLFHLQGAFLAPKDAMVHVISLHVSSWTMFCAGAYLHNILSSDPCVSDPHNCFEYTFSSDPEEYKHLPERTQIIIDRYARDDPILLANKAMRGDNSLNVLPDIEPDWDCPVREMKQTVLSIHWMDMVGAVLWKFFTLGFQLDSLECTHAFDATQHLAPTARIRRRRCGCCSLCMADDITIPVRSSVSKLPVMPAFGPLDPALFYTWLQDLVRTRWVKFLDSRGAGIISSMRVGTNSSMAGPLFAYGIPILELCHYCFDIIPAVGPPEYRSELWSLNRLDFNSCDRCIDHYLAREVPYVTHGPGWTANVNRFGEDSYFYLVPPGGGTRVRCGKRDRE
jgi:hypothetical protein